MVIYVTEKIGTKRLEVHRMKMSEQDQYIIKQYEQDESMMILIYAQWCVNNNLDAMDIYQQAYPNQPVNKALVKALGETVDKKESEEISIGIVQHVLQLFGNDDLAFFIQEQIDKQAKKKD